MSQPASFRAHKLLSFKFFRVCSQPPNILNSPNLDGDPMPNCTGNYVVIKIGKVNKIL